MWELRWILAGLGVALIVALYVWGRVARRQASDAASASAESDQGGFQERPKENCDVAPATNTSTPPAKPAERPWRRSKLEKIIALRLVPRAEEIRTEAAVLALRQAGLRLGRYGIFHSQSETDPDEMTFSVASLVEPGAFDLENLQDSTIPGMSIFMVLPGGGDPVVAFDRMVQASRSLARALDAELFDDRGSSWSIQRERYLREELISYRHQVGRAAK